MSLWFLLWFVLAFILLGATFWSTIILVQQKKAWKEYAKLKSLTFVENGFFESATVEGIVDGYGVSIFNALQQNPDARKNKQITVLQINANTTFVDGIACGTKEMFPFLQSLDALTPHDVKQSGWNKKHDIRTRNKSAVDQYLTEERVKILNNILSMPNTDVIVLLDGNEGMFRFETPNPLKDISQIETIIKKLLTRIKKLEPKDGERFDIVSSSAKVAIDVDAEKNKEDEN